VAGFNVNEFQKTLDRIGTEIEDLSHSKLPELVSITNIFLGKWYIPGFIKDAVKFSVDELVRLTQDALNTFNEILEGATVPIFLAEFAYHWEQVKGPAGSVAAEVTTEDMMPFGWQGTAATAYTDAIAPQSAAAGQLVTISDKTAISLITCAGAGLVFYGAILIVLIQLGTTTTAATAAVATGVAAPEGAAAAAASAGLSAAQIGTLIGTLSVIVGGEALQLTTLHGVASDDTAYPGGHWPRAATNSF
jgi:hypothetical protein